MENICIAHTCAPSQIINAQSSNFLNSKQFLNLSLCKPMSYFQLLILTSPCGFSANPFLGWNYSNLFSPKSNHLLSSDLSASISSFSTGSQPQHPTSSFTWVRELYHFLLINKHHKILLCYQHPLLLLTPIIPFSLILPISKSSSLAYFLTFKLQFHSSCSLYLLGTLRTTVLYSQQVCWDFLN